MTEKKPTKPKRPPVFLKVKKLIDPETGEFILALVAAHETDRRTMKERGYTVGTELKAELTKPRNLMFWRLCHILGGWLADNVDGFDGLGQHDAIKKLQASSNVGCLRVEYELPGFGKIIRVEPESLNFDNVEEGQFKIYWNGWIDWLRREKWGGISPEETEEVEKIILGKYYEDFKNPAVAPRNVGNGKRNS